MKTWILAGVVLAAAACTNPDILVEENRDLEGRSWKIGDTIRINLTVRNSIPSYSIDCMVRNSLEYPYARLFVAYQLQDSVGRIISKQLVSTYLFHEKTGAPFGSSGLGDVYDHRFPLVTDFRFPGNGRYQLQLVQQMRTDTLPGIMAVGARIGIKK